MKYLIVYTIISVIFETIWFLNGCKLIDKVWNWYIVTFVIIPLIVFLSPFTFPLSLLTKIRKLLGIKTKLEKEVDIENEQFRKQFLKAWKEHEGKNEGDNVF